MTCLLPAVAPARACPPALRLRAPSDPDSGSAASVAIITTIPGETE